MEQLTPEQRDSAKRAIQGENLFLTGAAGTGYLGLVWWKTVLGEGKTFETGSKCHGYFQVRQFYERVNVWGDFAGNCVKLSGYLTLFLQLSS